MTDETNGLYPGATKSFHKSTRKGKDKHTTADENKGRGKQLLEDLQLAGRRVREETLALVTSKSQVRSVRAPNMKTLKSIHKIGARRHFQTLH